MKLRIQRPSWIALLTFAVASVGGAHAGPLSAGAEPKAASTPFVLVQSKRIHAKSSATAVARLRRAARINRVPGALANASNRQLEVLKEDCQWTNDNVAACIVWDCGDDGVCVELGEYCVDGNGKVVACP